MFYRLVPVVHEIEAERFSGTSADFKRLRTWSEGRVHSNSGYVFVDTRDGIKRVYSGDHVWRAKGDYGVITQAQLDAQYESFYPAPLVQSVAPAPKKIGRPAGSNVGA